MESKVHQEIGDASTGLGLVNLGGEAPEERFLVSHGDVVALSGDFFLPHRSPAEADGLFELARVPGGGGTLIGSRDEIICALKVMSVDEGYSDPRFERGGPLAGCHFTPGADMSEVERRVRSRFLALAARNETHFVAPSGRDPAGAPMPVDPGGSAVDLYRELHRQALDLAWECGRVDGDLAGPMAWEAAGQHFLTDAFAAGHLRTPVGLIRRHWEPVCPGFWDNLLCTIAQRTAAAVKQQSSLLALLPRRFFYDRILGAIRRQTRDYPSLTVGDLVAKVFHDWDNRHGLEVEGGGMVFGDEHVDDATRRLAMAAVAAGNADVRQAHRLGAARRHQPGEELHRAVRAESGQPDGVFAPEAMIPRPSASNPPQNWVAGSVEELWEQPILGSGSTTVGAVIAGLLQPGQEIPRQLECRGRHLPRVDSVTRLPGLRRLFSIRPCEAYTRGYVGWLAEDPRRGVLATVHWPGAAKAEAA